MELSRSPLTLRGFARGVDLTANVVPPRYRLHEYELSPGSELELGNSGGWASLVAIEGEGAIVAVPAPSRIALRREEGAHLGPGARFRISASTKLRFLVASAQPIALLPAEDAALPPASPASALLPLSGYRVRKPWGWERWYTENLGAECAYALKLIFMTEGHQSSLQSHAVKSETNVVIEGVAEVLCGRPAPERADERIELESLERHRYGAGEGWSNRVRELHRVIARTDYKAVEASSPELDDVIRWADDARRPDGRIEGEHSGNAP